MQLLLEELVPFVGKGHVAGFLVQLVVAFLQQRDHIVDDFIHLGAVLRRARDNQRRPRLVDQNTIDFIHDGKVVLFLENLAQLRLHVIAQIIKAQLVVRGVGYVAIIGGAFVFLGHAGHRSARGQPKRGKDLAHPVGVPFHEVFVHRDHMHALAGQRIEVSGQRRGQGFTLAGFLLGYIALMQENRRHQLRVKGAQTQGPACAFTAVRKSFRQQIIKAFAINRPLAQLFRFLLQTVVGQSQEFFFQRVDLFNQRAGRLDFTVVWGPKDFFGECSDAQHAISCRSYVPRRPSACRAAGQPLDTRLNVRQGRAHRAM